VNEKGETFFVGHEIISVEYEAEENCDYTWFFGGFVNENTIAINVVSSKCNSQFFYRVKKGNIITLPELTFDDDAKLKYEVINIFPDENKIILYEILS
jgi:hypothetical protein